jgi:hypothetical protein
MTKLELIKFLQGFPDFCIVVAQTSNDFVEVNEVIYIDDGLIYLKIY